MTHVTRDL